MKLKRLWWTIRMCMLRNGTKRGDYLRHAGVFGYIGKNVSFQPRIVPLYSELIKLHDNVRIGRDVEFVTHDGIHNLLNKMSLIIEKKLREQVGCIEIMEDCFIGSNATIMMNVKIGPKVIVGSNSFVVKDCEPNSVYAGVPAKKIGTFDDYVERRIKHEQENVIAVISHNQQLSREEIKAAWDLFNDKHQL